MKDILVYEVSFKILKKKLAASKHIGLLLLHSKKRGAVQPIPIKVDRFSELVSGHLVKVNTNCRGEGKADGFPE